MEPNRGNQYDDDLTVGLDDIADESFDTGYVDLFEYAGEEESPISRLKNLMLSIEWEITDQILMDFNNELVQAQNLWADDPVKVVYTQALQKISKYIYQKKSDAHPNAMKVLITFFYDLEKIVLDTNISREEKEEILLDDVKKFERFKQQIGASPAAVQPVAAEAEPESGTPEIKDRGLDSANVAPALYNLKAYILSIDWEITDKELTEISKEVARLQAQWSDSKPQSLLLQGIDAVGGYIKLMKSASHADAFKLLNSFYLALEKIVEGALDVPQVKEIILAEAAKFNKFKEEIGDTITPEAIARHRAEKQLPDAEQTGAAQVVEISGGEETVPEQAGDLEQPPADEGFGDDESFSEEALEKVASFFGDLEDGDEGFGELSAEEALRGVDVETEADDDSDEEALPTLEDGVIAPALADLDDDEVAYPDIQETPPAGAVPGVDVETDADDDSDESPLPMEDGEPMPALFEGIDETAAGAVPDEAPDSDEINEHIDAFFDDRDPGSVEDDAETVEEAVAPALSGFDEEMPAAVGEEPAAEEIEDKLDDFLSEQPGLPAAGLLGDSRFLTLKQNVASLKDGLDGEKLDAIQNELTRLEDTLSEKPIEKTLTHLISAVVSGIGKKSGRFDGEAVELLNSVYANLETIVSSSLDRNEALIVLSDETAKILKWQDRMLSD